MPFKHACFVSYRHGQERETARLYTAFRRELAHQVDLYLPKLGVYLDETKLAGGDFLEAELSHAICHSVCMVVLYTPQYFDEANMYCAREYQAMINLEQRRLALVPQLDGRKGLILPVVIRDDLPTELLPRQAFTFSRKLLAADDLKLTSFRRVLAGIAEAIFIRYRAFDQAGVDPCVPCAGFRIPAEADVADWVKSIIGGSPAFPRPGRP
jgi:hypothetical protein